MLDFRLLNEINHDLCLKYQQRPTNTLKHSQSCRQVNDLFPFDYYRSRNSSVITRKTSTNENLSEILPIRTTNYLNTTLIRKAHLVQIRDDTSVLY